MTQASRPRASARFLAALPLLFIALFASSGAFAQQGLNFRMEPADGVIPIAKKGGEKCAARQRTVVGNTPGSITVVNDRSAIARWCASIRALKAPLPARPRPPRSKSCR